MNKNSLKNINRIFVVIITASAIFLGASLRTEANEPVAEITQKSAAKDLIVTRTFDAPVSDVWKYWAESEYVKKWWGPDGFTSPLARMDFRVGGTSLVCMRAPGGQDFYNTWTYKRIVPMKEIEFILDWADKDGNKTDPAKMGLPPDMPREVRHIITFKSLSEGKTEMTVTEYGYTSDQHLKLSKAGLEQCLNKMASALSKN